MTARAREGKGGAPTREKIVGVEGASSATATAVVAIVVNSAAFISTANTAVERGSRSCSTPEWSILSPKRPTVKEVGASIAQGFLGAAE